MFDLKRIAGTLKYGQFDGSKHKNVIISYVILTVLLLVGMTGVIAVVCVDSALPADQTFFSIIGIIFGFLSLPILFLVLIIKNEKTRNKIKLWLKDAVELDAFCKLIGEDFGGEALNQALSSPVSAKIQIRFKYNSKRIYRDSGYKTKSGSAKNAYQKIWLDYADKSVKILYSPEYDQVIILKNNT